MTKQVLVFFPHNPFPPTNGQHHRLHQVLNGLQDLGCAVTLASSQFTGESNWDRLDRRELERYKNLSLEVYWLGRQEGRYWNYARALYHRFRHHMPLGAVNPLPPSLVTWFTQLYRSVEPDLVLMHYAFYDRLITPEMHRQTATAIEVLDMVTVYRPRFEALKRVLPPPPIAPEQVEPALLDESFLDGLNLQVTPQEYAIYNKYTHTIVMAPRYAEMIRPHAPRTRLHVIPMTFELPATVNTYDGPAIFPTGPNPFSLQGYLYFVTRVLPQVVREVPDFCLSVTGPVSIQVTPQANVALEGFVPQLDDFYSRSRFLIAPILSQTGQQVKIVEAMAYGLPVVAHHRVAEGSPIVDGENGYIAHDEREFAKHVVRLWKDRELCARLGARARATIAAHYSRPRLLDGWRLVLE